jgi:adenylate cyclase
MSAPRPERASYAFRRVSFSARFQSWRMWPITYTFDSGNGSFPPSFHPAAPARRRPRGSACCSPTCAGSPSSPSCAPRSRRSTELRRFYAHAEKVLFPEALIDKLIGDEVMALYVPPFVVPAATEVDDRVRQHIAQVMLGHARQLLERVGYGSTGGPEFAIGIGLDFGEAFIGNIGDKAVHDFTAVGDVVNTASRLQGQAEAGEVVLSARLAQLLADPVGVPELVVLKGKQEPFDVRRVRWFPWPT